MRGVGGPFAALAALAFAVSAVLPWSNGQAPTTMPLSGLWQGFDGSATRFGASLALAVLFVAFVFLASAVSGSRSLATVGVLLGAGLIGLWSWQSKGVYQVTDHLLTQTSPGLWLAMAGLLSGLVSAMVPRVVGRLV